jgi:hypothetical protein
MGKTVSGAREKRIGGSNRSALIHGYILHVQHELGVIILRTVFHSFLVLEGILFFKLAGVMVK